MHGTWSLSNTVFHIALRWCCGNNIFIPQGQYTFNLSGIYSYYKNRKDLCNFYYHFFGLYLLVFKG
jgi:hypothetical protein